MSDVQRFNVGICGGLVSDTEGSWVSYWAFCESRDALVRVVDAQADEIERLRDIINPGTAAAYEEGAAALRQDAERYRWLRDRAGNAIMRELMGLCRSSEWDASIDAALREEGR